MNVGLTMIARSAENTLPATLESVKDYLSPIVIVLAGQPTDNTELVARQYTPYVFPYKGEELEDGGTADFAGARNYALQKFAEIAGNDSWFLWCDADDVVVGLENLESVIAEANKQNAKAIWMDYEYAYLPDGTCTTVFERERLMYDPTFYEWRYRVHEVIAPQQPINHMKTDLIKIQHKHSGTGSRTTRNLTLLHKQLEDDPGNKRTLFYLGHQYFVGQKWAEAVSWYSKYVLVADNPLEKWQAYIYRAKALRKLDMIDAALVSNMAALALFPEFRESWFDLAETYAYKKQWRRCLSMADIGRQMRPSPRILFVNPLDEVGWNVGMFEEVAKYHLGDLDGALEQVQQLRNITDSEYLKTKNEIYSYLVDTKNKGESWLNILDGMKPRDIVTMSKKIPSNVMGIPEVHDAVFDARFQLRKNKSGSKGRIVFYCGSTIEQWSPKSLNNGGIGGSETACIEITKRFASDGYSVEVYNDCGKHEGEYDGVQYWQYERFDPKEKSDLLVGWRQPLLPNAHPAARQTWLWMHDLHCRDRLTPELAADFDKVLGVSQYHADRLKQFYPFIRSLDFVPNGIDLERFNPDESKRKRRKVVYLSSPDRGLDVLLNMWPRIVNGLPEQGFNGIPDAELHVFYGFNNMEKIAKTNPYYQEFIDNMSILLDQPGVVNHGRLGQADLAKEICDASIWAYPTSFLETSCISAMESMAAGLAVIASKVGALPCTLGDAAILIPGHSQNEYYMNKFFWCLVALLLNDDVWQKYHSLSLTRAPQFSWDNAYLKWKELLG
jgi:glycosyltransferase involved in cell wall biosynthesis